MPKSIRKNYNKKTNKKLVGKYDYKRKSSKRTVLLKGGWGGCDYKKPKRKSSKRTFLLKGGGWGKPLTTNLIGGGWGGNPVVYDVNRKYYRDRIIKKYFKKHF